MKLDFEVRFLTTEIDIWKQVFMLLQSSVLQLLLEVARQDSFIQYQKHVVLAFNC